MVDGVDDMPLVGGVADFGLTDAKLDFDWRHSSSADGAGDTPLVGGASVVRSPRDGEMETVKEIEGLRIRVQWLLERAQLTPGGTATAQIIILETSKIERNTARYHGWLSWRGGAFFGR